MSFVLDLGVPGLTEEQGRAAEDDARRAGAWPIHFSSARRRRSAWSTTRDIPCGLWLPERSDGEDLLSDDAGWDGTRTRPEVVALALDSAFNEHTLYRVPDQRVELRQTS